MSLLYSRLYLYCAALAAGSDEATLLLWLSSTTEKASTLYSLSIFRYFEQRWLAALLLAILSTVGAASYWRVTRTRVTPQDLLALTRIVRAQPFTIRLRASAIIQPVQKVNLSPKSSGILEELLVEQGDRVEAGQIVARMEARELEAEVVETRARVSRALAELEESLAGNRPEEISQAEASVAQAEARVREVEAQRLLAEMRLRRNRDLARAGAIAADDFDRVENEVTVARATVDFERANWAEAQSNLSLMRRGNRAEDIAAAAATLEELQASLQSAEILLEDTVIKAPFSGIVTQKFATAGAFVTPTTSASTASSATSTAIVSIASGLEVLAEVPEVDIGKIYLGQHVEIIADAYPNRIFDGRVTLVAPEAVVEQNVTSFQVRIELVSGENVLQAGMNADVSFIGDEIPAAISVPTSTILTIDGKTGILILDRDAEIQFQPIELGLASNRQAQVLSGLAEGDRIFFELPPNRKIEDFAP
ncbi:efflux RND transporter periplasmic adaptor subunit [Synechococcus sp. PCC 7336]|uniref:efflux RND transporter periplasmic adaptor subunit n=1 Tax=Synechococcus sp. PCC 7336 TaxID=195250 RepID=UPI000345881E|nr:efflux RND transporter periplasmic adaptor subunit [Synechococcus sp. PCC 7336]